MKASEGVKYVDPTYATNRAQANANGLKVGAYHFAKPGTDVDDAIIEADHFVDDGAAGRAGDLLPVLDLEVTGGLSVAKLQTWVKAFLDRVYARTGERAMIYTSPSFWKNNMGDTTDVRRGRLHARCGSPTGPPAPNADRPGRQLGRQRLDLLAVHVRRDGGRDQRPRRPRPLPLRRLRAGLRPLDGPAASGGRSAAGRPDRIA